MGMMRTRTFVAALSACASLILAGCCSRVPTGPDRPEFDAVTSGQQAIGTYDKDGDGQISGEELKACPALEMALPRVDKNGDSAISADEVADRITYFQTAKTTIISGSTEVTMSGEPVVGATVTFEPETFMGSQFKTCTGETDERGVAFVTGHDSKFPGIYLGFYRVRISKKEGDRETIPAKYNTESTLGYEATDDIPEVNTVIQFKLEP